jgi:haloalkane dehalogenase
MKENSACLSAQARAAPAPKHIYKPESSRNDILFLSKSRDRRTLETIGQSTGECRLKALATALAGSPTQFGWLLAWQAQKFGEALPPSQKSHFEEFIAPLVADNFIKQSSSGPAFMQMAADFYEELRRNSARLPLAAALDLPVRVIWGVHDPYLTAALGEERASRFKNSSFHPIPAGHWLQCDQPEQVAQELLS